MCRKYEKYSKLPEMKRRCEDAEIKIPKFKNDFELRDYQVESVSWMIMNWKTRTSCILADEMGLGKTAQAIAVLEYQRHYCNIRGPFLVVAPITTLGTKYMFNNYKTNIYKVTTIKKRTLEERNRELDRYVCGTVSWIEGRHENDGAI